MKLKTMCVVIDSGNSDELSDFYQKLLGWKKIKPDDPDDEWIYVINDSNDGVSIELIFQEIKDYKRPHWPATSDNQQQMMHLDFHVDDVEEGVRHALSCGAELSKIQLEDSWRVMLDPAGHPFCILP